MDPAKAISVYHNFAVDGLDGSGPNHGLSNAKAICSKRSDPNAIISSGCDAMLWSVMAKKGAPYMPRLKWWRWRCMRCPVPVEVAIGMVK